MSFTARTTGGEYTHKLTAAEMPSHIHNEYAMVEGYTGWDTFTPLQYSMLFRFGGGDYRGDVSQCHAARVPLNTFTSSEGGSQSHNNIQPFIVTYFWRRVS